MTSPRRAALVASFGLAFLILHPAQPRSQTSSLDETFAQVRELRAQGDFDQAISLLSNLIKEHSQSEQVLRKAYNDLVFTCLSQRNSVEDPEKQKLLQANMVKSADEALTRFPDLQVDSPEYPPDLGTIYDTRRALLFGRVEVTSTADSSRVFLRAPDSEEAYQGVTPLVIPYVPVGEYTMTVTRSGYKDREVPLTVAPSAVVQREVTLSKERTKKWWLTRVVAPVTAGVAVVAAIVVGTKDNTTTDPTQPLDGPPPPPTQ